MPKHLTFGLFLTCRTVLWLAGFFALLGLLWRNPVEMSRLQSCCITLSLTVWVGFLILFSPVFSKSEQSIGRYVFWVPALLIGFLLPPPLPILYIALLGTVAMVRWVGIRKSHDFLSDNPDTDEKSYEANDTSITQQIVRRQTAEGKERLEGNFLIEFHHDQWTATIHVPFCPAFDSSPKVEVFLLDDADVKWKVFEPRTFGVRIDIKRCSRETSRFHLMVAAESLYTFHS